MGNFTVSERHDQRVDSPKGAEQSLQVLFSVGVFSLSWSEGFALLVATVASSLASVAYNVGVIAAVRSSQALRVRRLTC